MKRFSQVEIEALKRSIRYMYSRLGRRKSLYSEEMEKLREVRKLLHKRN